MPDEVYIGPGVIKTIGEHTIVILDTLVYQGPAVVLYLWAGLIQDDVVVYESVGWTGVHPFMINLPVQEHAAPTTINANKTFDLSQIADVHPGPVDAMIMVSKISSMEQDAWLCRAIWTDAYIMQ